MAALTDSMPIDVQKITNSRIKEVDFDNLDFGKHFADHMLVAEYADGQWKKVEIIPYGNISLSPATQTLHYSQTIFEGMKAYKNPGGDVLLFRPLDNFKRFNISATRMCMPLVPEEIFMEGMVELLRLDSAWVPDKPEQSLYVRPFMFGSDPFIGVRPSNNYHFMIFTCPVGGYYPKPVKVKIEMQYIRSAEGGTGFAKCGGNYGGSLYPTKLVQEQGYEQLIWTDAKEHKYIEESGTMNVMFVVDGKLLTPAVSSTILDGITRKSLVDIAKHWGMEVEERRISVEEIIQAASENRLEAAFGAGTAVVVSPFSSINYEGTDYDLPALTDQSFPVRAKKFLSQIRTGRAEDVFGWTYKI